ncbi:probable G-protein coupled receptor B0563.6 [Dreissena polymorpha]|uniref:G-protein coupled receptors family 1 profile domain-containing protein n=1 Tax=Dreissena polymorpha TaxID=45954 RepID=A0A9D4L1E3_DREPO|nr:probable G-protein coupled receptor B0563.6 [Dreissena polymorpha]KAH3848937.1 hypothetical protein DPMN_091322 [Dreissena polymorpha]
MTTFPPNLTTAVHDVNSTYVNETSLNATAAPLGVTGSRIGGGGAATFYFPWNNPTNVMTQGTSENITTALQCYVFPILTLSGVTGNIMSLIVLFQRKLRDSTTTVVLIGLSFSDMVFLVTNYVRKSTCIIDRYDKMAGDTLTATTFYYMFYLKTAFSRVSTILIVVISAERLIAVAFPFKVKMLVTKPKMIATVLLSYVVTLGALAGLPPQYTYAYIRGKPVISQTQFAKDNAVALKGYNEYFLPIVFRHIPVFVVFILNIVIIVILRRSAQFQKNASSKDDKRRRNRGRSRACLLRSQSCFSCACCLETSFS